MARPKNTKNIETPDALWEYFQNYCEWVKNNPILVHDYVGAMATEVSRQKQRPLTIEGFNVWLSTNTIIQTINDYFGNKNDAYGDYSDVCSRIKNSIRANQIEGGMVGIYNPSITQRLNNLVEKQEVKTETTVKTITLDLGK
jgi:DNA-packaging protein gp3